MARFYSRAVLALTLWFISNNHSMGLSPGQVTVCVYGPYVEVHAGRSGEGGAGRGGGAENVSERTTDRQTDGRTDARIDSTSFQLPHFLLWLGPEKLGRNVS